MASSINLLDLTEELPRLTHRVDRHLWLYVSRLRQLRQLVMH